MSSEKPKAVVIREMAAHIKTARAAGGKVLAMGLVTDVEPFLRALADHLVPGGGR